MKNHKWGITDILHIYMHHIVQVQSLNLLFNLYDCVIVFIAVLSECLLKTSVCSPLFQQLVGYSEKPVNLQMFIGTADDRYLRPHAFYQVHRITGKTVATASQEIIIASTKVLEIPLLPENNMSARYLPAALQFDINLDSLSLYVSHTRTFVFLSYWGFFI